MDFRVHITMDGEAMKHPRNVARALERLARELDEKFAVNADSTAESGIVRDVAGAVVGTWTLSR